MKTVHKTRTSSESCSCNTCVYKSESDHPSLRRIIDLGSRIDRLYYGKYIPLRERKLLERLVRTRAVYNDIRAQLVSDSTLSLSTKGDYNPKKKVSVRELDDTEKSSGAVLELVNMVDRGAIGSKKLDECCSCCSCSSKIKIHEQRHRQKQIYEGTDEYLARQRRLREISHKKKGVRFKAKHIRSDPCTCTFKLIKKHSKAMFKKMHQGPPEPLLDLQSKTDEEIKRIRGRIGDIARVSYQNLKESNTRMKEKISEGISKLRESQTRIQEKIELQAKLSKEKFNQAKDKLASKIREINKSEWQLGPENELAFHVRKDSISKFKEELRRKQIMKDWECEPECFEEVCVPEECFTKLKQKKLNRKNIHHKGISYNIKTQERKAGEPLRHYDNKIQAQKSTKAKLIETKGPVLQAQQSRNRVNYDEVPKKAQKEKEISILKNKPITLMRDRINVENAKISHSAKKTKLKSSSLERKSSQRQAIRIGSSFSFNVEFYKDKPGQEIPAVDSQPYKVLKQHPGIDYRHETPIKDKETKKRHLRQQGSQIKFKRSFKDTQTSGRALKRCFCTLKLKAKRTKSKIRRPVTKKIMTTEKSALTLGSPTELTLHDVQTNTEDIRGVHKISKLLSYECEPGVCTPGACDPYQCIKIINIRESKHKNSKTQAHKTKSTSSYTSRSYKTSKTKNVQSKVSHRGKASKPKASKAVEKQRLRPSNPTNNSHRQAVRIGSTFSFNLEFYKDSPYYQQTSRPASPPPSNINTLLIKPKQKAHQDVKLKDRGYQGDLENVHRNTPTQVIKKERNALIGTTIGRCFCTLALQGKDMKNHSTKTFTVGTETSELKPIDTANKGTKTKLKYSPNRSLESYECEPFTCVPGRCDPYICLDRLNMRKIRLKQGNIASDRHETSLKPYECEPFTCIPGECDPYVCLERINKRNKRFREVGLTTGRSKTTSSSSGNTEKSMRTLRVQYKPKQKERKTLARTQKPKKYSAMKSEKYDVSKYAFNPKLRQAVKIGSTFSFDIEFYKNKSRTQEIKKVYPTERNTKAKKKMNKKSIDKGIKMNRFNVAQEETQVQGLKKRDKGSIVKPLLKRCFCTLNLQKKWKHQYSKKGMSPSEKVLFQPPRIYTVNRVMIENTKGVTRYKYQIPLQNSSRRNLNKNQPNKTSFVVQEMQDNINAYKIDKTWKLSRSQECKKNERIYSQQYVKGADGIKSFTTNPSLNVQIHKTRFTSLTRYFRRCYYAMNLKVENERNYKKSENKVSSKRKHALHKLLPYECEPGLCIPGECNPYECQKMIAKRLMMKSPSKKSGTEYSFHSISSSANQPVSRSKQYKQQTMKNKSRRPQVYTGKTKEKQAVRIGSSFSFDIEFSKKLATSHKDLVMPKYSSDTNLSKRVIHSKSKGTGNKKLNSNSQSQSALVKTIHRGSFTKPSMKRCFCTLKLQKKGRLYEEFKNQQPLNGLSKEKTVSRGQNTKKIKPLKLSYALEPYECEPNICIPGQCDPHQCLERIKKRNIYAEEVGTNTIFYDTKSISSMNTDNQRKKIQRSRAVSVKPKKSTITEKGGKKHPEYNNLKPLREAVRVGSSFSFNVEFYKDVPPSHPHGAHTYVKRESKENKHSREPTLKKHVIDKYAQNSNNLINKHSQFGNLTRHASTLTNSFIKRCFCTAQLYKNSKNINENFESKTNKNSPSFKQRCFCVLKKIKLSKPKTKNDIKPKETQEKMINTLETKTKLEPYECKPGICVPGECDPYVCDKIMKKYRNQNSKAISCDTLKRRSISSNSAYIPKKNVKSSIKRKQNLTVKNGSAKRQRAEKTKSINEPNATSWSSNRNAVRIGSQFSFDIEFFKEHPLKIKKSITHTEKSPKDNGTKKKVKVRSTKSFSPSYISQSSQVKKEKVKDRGTGINYLIKRCFCTLKLNENNDHSNKANKREDIDDQILKKVKTKSVMTVEKKNLFTNALLPYECEPYTCTPYQCDPYECEKRIKLRYKNKVREFGVSTSPPKKVSAHSVTDTKKPKTKIRSLSTKNLHKRAKNTPRMYSSRSKVGQPKQSVRIGSAFSFNIEFFKDKQHDGVEFQKLPKKDHSDRLKSQMKDKRKTIIKHANQSNKKMDTSQTQSSKKLMRTNETQLADQVMRTQSTMTGFTPKKRCFCTLSLKKSKDNLPLPPKTLHASTETEVFKTTNYSISNLLPYECEPNICVPGECNPVQCLERIKRRQNILLPYECEPNICIPGECDPFQCLKRIKRRNKTFGTDTKESEKINVSTLMKHTNNDKNKMSQIKQLHQPISKKVLVQKTGNNKNRQAVRISSNFSFDVEFFRTNNLNAPELSKLDKTDKKHQFKNKTASSNLETKKLRNRALQSSSPKKVSHGVSVGPFLKRCFCTLKLQKALINKDTITVDKHLTKPKHRQTSTESKGTATKKTPKIHNLSPFECEPFFCIPGQCNPYECAKRIEMRDKKYKSQYTITQSHDQSHKGVGIKEDNNLKKSQRNQANFVKTNAFVPKSSIHRPETVEIPMFANSFNNQAVRIGSKFSLNIEFYKENLPPNYNPPKPSLVDHRNDKKLKRKKQKSIHHDDQNTDRTHLRSTGSEYDKTKTRNKSVKAENTLKRCFCTLELQNRSSSKNKKQEMHQNKVPFAQNFEIRRIAVQHNPKMLSKGTHIGVKSVSTKISKKKLKRNEDSNIPCNLYICKNGKTLLPDDNMKTILPFTPEKFNKTVSRTVLPPETKYVKSKGSRITNRGKRLTRKNSKKHLNNKQPITQEKDKRNKSFGIKKIIECCGKIFNLTPKSQNLLFSEKNERQASPNQFVSNLKPKKCSKTCPYYSINQNGDTKFEYPRISVKLNKKEIIKSESVNKKSSTKQQIVSKMKNKESFCPCSRKLLHKKQNTEPESLNLNWNPKQKENIKINESRDRSRPLKVSFFDTVQSDKKNFEKLQTSKNKRFASVTKSERLVPSSNYCHPCKGKITKEEFHKAAGDQLFINQKLANQKGSNCNVTKIISKIREVCYNMPPPPLPPPPEKPLFEMQVDSESYEILNRNEVVHNITKLNTIRKPRIEIKVDSQMHKILNRDKLCPCRRCICGSGGKILKLSGKPCICGSPVCAKKLQSAKTPITRRKWKTCLCGSPVCDQESTKLKSYVENKCLCQKEMAIRKAKRLAKEKKERAIRLKVYQKSDKMRRQKRKQEQKRMEKSIDKKATDGILLAESVLDIGKLGITATTDILRQVCRCARDPKSAYQTLRTLKENPKLAAKFLKSTYNNTGFTATLRRIRLRCLAMKGMQKLRRTLESYSVSRYLMYINSKDPKRRWMKTKKKPPRERERMDFNCSLYMASLRKRPFLSIYDRCPWFYQHFLSLVRAWRQFLDICLFLLAAVVWSPCILCMEICRACMCCFFCTG